MPTVVVPFRSSDPKRRLTGISPVERERLAEAMLMDVLAAAEPLGEVLVVATGTPPLPAGVRHVADPRRGHGAAVQAGLDAAVALLGPYLVVNADLPCATTRDLLALVGVVPDAGLALVAAADGTTNALALADAALFQAVYGPGSAARFAALAPARLLESPNLADDVDTTADLTRLRLRVGANTGRVLAALHLETAA